MIKPEEKPIRTDNKGMLVCTSVQNEDGDVRLIKRDGKKEDSMTVNSFLSKVYGKSVTILVD